MTIPAREAIAWAVLVYIAATWIALRYILTPLKRGYAKPKGAKRS